MEYNDKDMDEELSTDKKLLSHDLLKLVGGFLKKHSGDVAGLAISIATSRPTLSMTEDGKCHTGAVVQCTVNTWDEPDDDDDFDYDDE